jgi:hypothetical protein
MITTISTVDNTSRPKPISHRFGSVALSMINTNEFFSWRNEDAL